MIPTKLREIEDYLKGVNLELPKSGVDGRADSATGESYVLQILQNVMVDKGWNIKSPNTGTKGNRFWYDMEVDGRHYCNIKISECGSAADNTNAKAAIYYFLTGKPADSVSQQDKIFFKEMSNSENPDEDRDYFFLVVNKTKKNDVFFVSLKGLTEYRINPRNLPFQVQWRNNRVPTNRTWAEARQFLLKGYAESVKKLIQLTNDGMPRHYPEFFS